MDEPFLLPVLYKGTEHELETTLQVLGYIHRFRVNVDGVEVFFERDEEGRYRGLIPPETQGEARRLPALDLMQAIAETIEQLLA
jgi:hypothetical protein